MLSKPAAAGVAVVSAPLREVSVISEARLHKTAYIWFDGVAVMKPDVTSASQLTLSAAGVNEPSIVQKPVTVAVILISWSVADAGTRQRQEMQRQRPS